MIRFFAILSALLLAGCLPFEPVQDSSKFVRLSVEVSSSDKTGVSRYAAPITTASAPAYMDQSTIWFSDTEGRLSTVNGFLWAESLPDAVQRGLALLLSKAEPYPADYRINLNIDRFILMSDGSAEAVLEAVVSTSDSVQTQPIISARVEEAWNPQELASFLEGYQKLLRETGKRLKKELERMGKAP